MYQVEKSKTGLETLKYNDKYIHSSYDPLREAERFAIANKELLKDKIVVTYGLGLGYHIVELERLLDEDSTMYVFEANINLIKYCKKINKKVFEYSNIKIIGKDNTSFYSEFSNKLKEVNDIIIHKPSLETIRYSNRKLYNLINDFSIIKQQHEREPEMVLQAEENLRQNLNTNPNRISRFIDKCRDSDKPYVIVSAGPSLDCELELLKDNRNRFNIFSVGSALRTLTDERIIPDCVVIIDPREIVKKQFEGIDCKDIPLCFDGKASRWAINTHNGEKFIFNYDKDENNIETGGTVAVAAINLAIECGANKIILLGQDLAFIGESSHTKSFEKTYGFKDKYKDNFKNKFINGIDGRPVRTIQSYITFKNKIESTIQKNNLIDFINSSKGAYIEGARHLEFKKVIDLL